MSGLSDGKCHEAVCEIALKYFGIDLSKCFQEDDDAWDCTRDITIETQAGELYNAISTGFLKGAEATYEEAKKKIE